MGAEILCLIYLNILKLGQRLARRATKTTTFIQWSRVRFREHMKKTNSLGNVCFGIRNLNLNLFGWNKPNQILVRTLLKALSWTTKYTSFCQIGLLQCSHLPLPQHQLWAGTCVHMYINPCFDLCCSRCSWIFLQEMWW